MSSILITGASKGIGRASAIELAARGHRVIATARNPETLRELDVAERLALDVTDQASVDAAILAAGEVDILVSNAGAIFTATIEASPVEEIERLFAQNTIGAMRVTKALLPSMRERGRGRLLYVSSVVGRIVRPGAAAYGATKWALEAFVEALETEVGHFGIHAVLLEPGAVDSGALDNPPSYGLPEEPYARLLEQVGDLRGAMISTEDVARAIADAAERDSLPLRIPVGPVAERVLAVWRDAPTDQPFLPAPLDW
jgi:NADP-dependent 3-hydroxy acid dehydrogenase YdfG